MNYDNLTNEKRMKYLNWSKPEKIAKIFKIVGIGFLSFGLFITLLIYLIFGKNLSKDDLIFTMIMLLSFSFGFFIIFFSIGKFFIPLIIKLIEKGQIDYEINNNIKLTKEQIKEEAMKINNTTNKYIVKVNGDWIDVTYNFKDNVELGIDNISFNQSFFYKLFLINDDNTYEELDFFTTKVKGLKINALNMDTSYQIGHLKINNVSVVPSIDRETGNAGMNKYSINTTEITNDMRKWFADHGYKLKK